MDLLQLNKPDRFGVISITPKHDSFETTKGKKMWCHFIVLCLSGSPTFEPFNAQLCTDRESVNEFEVNDIIEAIPTQYDERKCNYTIRFVAIAEANGMSLRKKAMATAAEVKSKGGSPNPMYTGFGARVIAGSAADRAMSHAVHLHHMKPTTIGQVLDDATRILAHLEELSQQY